MKSIRFRPTYRATLSANKAALDFMAGDKPNDPALQASYDKLLGGLPKQRTRAAPRQLEAPVMQAISELLARHPRVLFACRQNSGMASYEAKSGKYAPVYFYRILTHTTLTITDFWGILKDGRVLAVEAKAPGFREPRTDRELRQANFINMVRNCGGVALFATSANKVAEALK